MIKQFIYKHSERNKYYDITNNIWLNSKAIHNILNKHNGCAGTISGGEEVKILTALSSAITLTSSMSSKRPEVS
jgi:hypothetical protein